MDPADKYTSKYLDVPNTPLYPFGYGLSYTRFQYGKIRLSSTELEGHDSLVVSVTITNTGDHDGEEVVQLYTRDLVGSLTRPVKELKGFRKVRLDSGESLEVSFTLTVEDLKFVNGNLEKVAEPGEFKVFVGPDSETVNEATFTLIN